MRYREDLMQFWSGQKRRFYSIFRYSQIIKANYVPQSLFLAPAGALGKRWVYKRLTLSGAAPVVWTMPSRVPKLSKKRLVVAEYRKIISSWSSVWLRKSDPLQLSAH